MALAVFVLYVCMFVCVQHKREDALKVFLLFVLKLSSCLLSIALYVVIRPTQISFALGKRPSVCHNIVTIYSFMRVRDRGINITIINYVHAAGHWQSSDLGTLVELDHDRCH